MAPRAPRVSGSVLIKALEHLGYFQVRTSGDHVRLHHHFHHFRLPTTVPLHDVIGPGLLRKILRDTGLTISAWPSARVLPSIHMCRRYTLTSRQEHHRK